MDFSRTIGADGGPSFEQGGTHTVQGEVDFYTRCVFASPASSNA